MLISLKSSLYRIPHIEQSTIRIDSCSMRILTIPYCGDSIHCGQSAHSSKCMGSHTLMCRWSHAKKHAPSDSRKISEIPYRCLGPWNRGPPMTRWVVGGVKLSTLP